MPALARPGVCGFANMARLTVAPEPGEPSGPLPTSPFQVLSLDATTNDTHFRVMHGTFLGVQVVRFDELPPWLGKFAADAEFRRQLPQ